MALGCIKLSLDDFCALSPDEFRAIHRMYIEQETERMHGEWERVRILATITVQPNLGKPVDAKRLLPLPWDKKINNAEPKKSTRERFEYLAKKFSNQ